MLCRLDLYLPKNNDGPKPVVAFITGGAWIIGWGMLFLLVDICSCNEKSNKIIIMTAEYFLVFGHVKATDGVIC